jgi:multisubunit Na+/H+ antiporter MnhE subunit
MHFLASLITVGVLSGIDPHVRASLSFSYFEVLTAYAIFALVAGWLTHLVSKKRPSLSKAWTFFLIAVLLPLALHSVFSVIEIALGSQRPLSFVAFSFVFVALDAVFVFLPPALIFAFKTQAGDVHAKA